MLSEELKPLKQLHKFLLFDAFLSQTFEQENFREIKNGTHKKKGILGARKSFSLFLKSNIEINRIDFQLTDSNFLKLDLNLN